MAAVWRTAAILFAVHMHHSTIHVLESVTFFLWLVFIVGLFILLWEKRTKPQGIPPSWAGTTLWLTHGMVLYTVILSARLLVGYQGPSLWATLWSAALIFHGVFALVAASVIRMRQ